MKLILGSKSPRRKELLEGLGFQFEIRTKETDESFDPALPIEQIPQQIAKAKARDLADELTDDEVLICADTIVVANQKVLGKPANKQEAIAMLQQLSGRTHKVITGVVVLTHEKQQAFSVTTQVEFTDLTAEEVEFYIEKYAPYDKAGGYGIQEWIGYAAIKKINGSYTNVVGLPTCEVYQALKNFIFD